MTLKLINFVKYLLKYSAIVCHKLVQYEVFKLVTSKSIKSLPHACIHCTTILYSLYNYLLNLVSLVKCFADLVILSNALVVAAYVVAFDGENLTTVAIE